jgi:hypothetical protein
MRTNRLSYCSDRNESRARKKMNRVSLWMGWSRRRKGTRNGKPSESKRKWEDGCADWSTVVVRSQTEDSFQGGV